MDHSPSRWIRPEAVLDALFSQDARVAGDVLEVEAGTWAIHGVVPVDGEVIRAEFDCPEAARAVLDRLAIEEVGGETTMRPRFIT